MKYFRHQNDDIRLWTNHAHWDAEHGRVMFAICRLEELASEFPLDAHIAYDQGLLWNHHAGNGRRSRDYFLRAEKLAAEQRIKGTRWYAAQYLAKLSDSASESRNWIEVVLSLAPRIHPSRQVFRSWLEALDTGADIGELFWRFSTQSAGLGEYGTAAAIAEFSLAAVTLGPREEAARRRNRAEMLRALDRTESQQRTALGELFPPEDRPALLEAIAEIERALLADSHDAMMWNLRSAWNQMLGRNEQAVEFADKAISLRPNAYSRPWVNKAAALYDLKLDQDALSCARTALEMARSSGADFADDVAEAERKIGIMSVPRVTTTLVDLRPIMEHALAAANSTCQQRPDGRKPGFLANGIRTRIRATGSQKAISYVPMMAQFLSDFSPEIAFRVTFTVSEKSIADFMLCMNAAMYLAADTSGVIQRDAAQFLLLALFSRVMVRPDFVRQIYREAVLEPCRNAGPPLADLEEILRTGMSRFHPDMARLIANQEPLTEMENERGKRLVRQHFTGDPHEFEMDAPQAGLAVNNDPDTGTLQRFFKSSTVGLKGLWMLISGPAGRRPPGRRQ